MSDNPFNRQASPEPEPGFSQLEVQRGFSRLGWAALILALVAAIYFLVGWYQALERQHSLEGLLPKLDAMQNDLARSRTENEILKAQLDATQKSMDDLTATSQMAKSLEDEMRTALESKD